MKKLITTFAAVGIVGLAACAAEEEEPVIVDEPVIEEPAPAPAMTEPMMEDTMMMTDSTMMAEPTTAE